MKIDIKGVIVPNSQKIIYDWYGLDAVSPRDVVSKLDEAKGEDIEISINSGGGDVYSGAEIYTALREYKGNVTGKIVGIAASAASVIGMGCKTLKMSPAGQFMIHKASITVSGNDNKMEHAAEVLQSHDQSICNVYSLKTGMSQDDLLDLMDKETYFNAQQALKHGFIDEIMFDDDLKLSASVNNSAELPIEVINKTMAALAVKNEEPKTNENGAATEPVSDIGLTAQQKKFRELKLKLLGGN
jgi:ATP-dependent Clp protease protease subunit